MAFTRSNWTKYASALNSGKDTGGGQITPAVGGPDFFGYQISTDDAATVGAANYFSSAAFDLCVGDFLFCNCSDTFASLRVTAVDRTVNPATVSTETLGLATAIGTANIVDGAVTAAKLASDAVTTVKILNNNVTSAKLALTTVQYTSVAITAAQFNGMYAAPKLLVAAAGANTLIVLDKVELLMTYVSANYAAGGVVAVQYDSTANGAGVIASTTLSAATFQAAVSTGFMFNTGVVPQTFSTCVNKGLYLSNVTGAFTTGDSTFVAHIWYKVVATV